MTGMESETSTTNDAYEVEDLTVSIDHAKDTASQTKPDPSFDRLHRQVKALLHSDKLNEENQAGVELLRKTLRTGIHLDKLPGHHREIIQGSEAFDMSELIVTATKSLKKRALETIRTNPKMLLGLCYLLSKDGLEKILKDKDMEADEYTMFRILETWAKGAASNENGFDRSVIASSLVKHIALDLIDPALLGTKIRSSGLVSDAQLVEAFLKQAASTKFCMPLRKTRGRSCVWEKSGTDLYTTHVQLFKNVDTDKVVGRTVKSGIHQWSFRTKADAAGYVCLGIASVSANPECGYLGSYLGGWSVSSRGYHSRFDKARNKMIVGMISDWPTPTSSSQVLTFAFTLFLSSEEDGNRLELSLNGAPPVTVFSGTELSCDGSGFVPAASICGKGAVRFLNEWKTK